MIGYAALADDLTRQLRAIGWLDEEDERRGRRIGGGGAFRTPKSRGGSRAGGNGLPTSAVDVHAKQSVRRATDSKPQAAVVKVASFAAGARRVGALTDYLSRDGALAVETEAGRLLQGIEAIKAETTSWTPLFSDRAPSKDVASMRISGLSGTNEAMAQALSHGFDGRRFAWRHEADMSLRVVVVLAAKDRRRLDVAAAGRSAIAARLTKFAEAEVTVDGVSTGHGRDGLGYRLSRLVSRGPVELSDGRRIGTPQEASALTREWSASLNSRRIRDTMHLVLSAKAGTDIDAFRLTAREFLGETFAGRRYLFAIHQDRDHLHAHAVVTMRGTSGPKLDPRIGDFSRWRESYAAAARAHGIDMVATRRLERAAAPSYTLKDLNLIASAERAGEPIPIPAQRRVAAKQADAIHVPSRREGRIAVARARLTATAHDDTERLAVADVAATFLADLKTIWSHSTRKETEAMAMRPIEDLQADLKAMNATATRIALLLPAESRPQFHALAGPILQGAAAVVDQAAAAVGINATLAVARTVLRQEEREAREAEKTADLARRAADPLRRNETPGSRERLASEDLARQAERQAQRERSEAVDAAALTRQLEAAADDQRAAAVSVDQNRDQRPTAEPGQMPDRGTRQRNKERERGIEDEM